MDMDLAVIFGAIGHVNMDLRTITRSVRSRLSGYHFTTDVLDLYLFSEHRA